MKEIISNKEIEDGVLEIIVPNDKDIPSGYLLTLSREGYTLFDEQCDVEWDVDPDIQCVDIYYFKK
jgi:hypothetical protein